MKIGPLDCDALRDGGEKEQEALRKLGDHRRRMLKRLRSELDHAIEDFDTSEKSVADHWRLLGDSNIALNSYQGRCHEIIDEVVKHLTGVDVEATIMKLMPYILEKRLRGFAIDEDGKMCVVNEDGEPEPLEEELPEIVDLLRSMVGMPGVPQEVVEKFETQFGSTETLTEDEILSAFDALPVAEPERPVRDFDGKEE